MLIGLGLAELLSGVAQTIRKRATVRLYWVHFTLVIVVFLALLQMWWEIWGVRATPAWTFPGLLMMLGGPIGLFLIAHLMFPERLDGADLRAYYYQEMQPAYWLAAATVLVSTTFRPLALGFELFTVDNLSSLVLLAVFVALARTRNALVHSVAVVIVLVALVLDIVLLSMEIQ